MVPKSVTNFWEGEYNSTPTNWVGEILHLVIVG